MPKEILERTGGGLADEVRWLLRIGAAVAGLVGANSLTDGLVCGSGNALHQHELKDGHSVVVERVESLEEQLDRIEYKIDELGQ